jgi:hypothetical protein
VFLVYLHPPPAAVLLYLLLCLLLCLTSIPDFILLLDKSRIAPTTAASAAPACTTAIRPSPAAYSRRPKLVRFVAEDL